MQSRLRRLRNSHDEVVRVLENERKIIIGDLFIDYNCFRKTKHEKELLKLAKWNLKNKKLLHT